MIPKTIHYCWVGGNPLPDSAKKCIASWKKYCPDYEIVEWNETNYDFTKIPYMKEAYDAKKWGFVPDYARLDIIYTHGGIYLDTDVEIVKSFDPLLHLKGFAGFQDNKEVALGLGFGAEAGNTVIKILMDSYEALSFLQSDGTPDLTPSPQLNTAVLVQNCGLMQNGKYQDMNGLAIFPTEYFCPKSFEDGVIRKTRKTYSIHHFDASWYTDEQRKAMYHRWDNYKEINRRKNKRKHKLWRRRVFGGFFRRLFGDERWERFKARIFKRR